MSLFGKPNKNPAGPGTAIGQIIGFCSTFTIS